MIDRTNRRRPSPYLRHRLPDSRLSQGLSDMSMLKRILRPLRVALGKTIILPQASLTRDLDWNASMTLIEKAARFVVNDKIAGDYLEFGVFRGGAFAKAYQALRRTYEQRIADTHNASPADCRERQEIWNATRFFAFDSFQGLPELRGVDQQTRDFAQGQYEASQEDFLASIAQQKVDLQRVTCVPGWFEATCRPETIATHQLKKASIIWIDCDLYHSAKTVLQFITPLLQDGAVIIFDDWYAYRGNPRLGEQRAFREWRETVQGFTFTEFHKEGAYRNSFIASDLNVSEE